MLGQQKLDITVTDSVSILSLDSEVERRGLNFWTFADFRLDRPDQIVSLPLSLGHGTHCHVLDPQGCGSASL